MPLSEAGKRMLRRFKQEYGKEKGEDVFYAKENTDKKFAHLVKHGSRKHHKK